LQEEHRDVIMRDLRFSRLWRFKSRSSELCSDMVEYQRFRRAVVHFIFRVKGRWRQHGPSKRSYPTTSLHDITTLTMKAVWTSETLVSYHINT